MRREEEESVNHLAFIDRRSEEGELHLQHAVLPFPVLGIRQTLYKTYDCISSCGGM